MLIPKVSDLLDIFLASFAPLRESYLLFPNTSQIIACDLNLSHLSVVDYYFIPIWDLPPTHNEFEDDYDYD